MIEEPPVRQDHPRLQRVLGRYTTGLPGPTVVVTAGIHGNEPAGTRALQRVFATLEERRLPLRGKLLGLTGNIAALEQGVRFVDRDLNRGWSTDTAARVLGAAIDELTIEDREQRELLGIFVGIFAEAKDPVVFLDLHSTSAGGCPFSAIADTLRNRTIAFHLPVPVILGLEETISGTMLSYLDGLGHISAVFEGGQHDDPATIDNHESAVWLALEAAGALTREEIPDRDALRERLDRAAADRPEVVELRYREGVDPARDGFVMRPGYVNFQPIRAGEAVADNHAGAVRAPEDGRILMPLYQKQGDDGFFLVRDVRRFWLRVSTVIRRLRLDWMLNLLPGVRRGEGDPDLLLADPRVCRYYLVEVFHLFGFRDCGERPDGTRCFRRRRPDYRKLARVGLDGSASG